MNKLLIAAGAVAFVVFLGWATTPCGRPCSTDWQRDVIACTIETGNAGDCECRFASYPAQGCK